MKIARLPESRKITAEPTVVGNITVTSELVTPDIAESWLAARTDGRQRPLSEPHAVRLANSMTRGKWQESGDAIRFDLEGSLIDGQHRLRACVISGVPFRTLVMRGLELTAFSVIDQGRKRSSGDTFAIMGFSNYVQTGQMARILIGMRDGVWSARGGLDNADVEYLASRHRADIEQVVAICVAAPKYVSPGMLAAIMFLANMRNPDLVREFTGQFCSGADLEYDSPVRHLRERLSKDRMRMKRALRGEETLPLVVSAWNAFADGRKIKNLLPARTMDITLVNGDWRRELWPYWE